MLFTLLESTLLENIKCSTLAVQTRHVSYLCVIIQIVAY